MQDTKTLFGKCDIYWARIVGQ